MLLGVAYPANRDWPKWDWVCSAAQSLGHCVRKIRSFEDLKSADGECDLVLFSQYTAGLDRGLVCDYAKARRSKWAQWWFDRLCYCKPAESGAHVRYHLPMLRSMDFVFVKDRDCIQELRELGVAASYLDQGCPSNLPAVDLDCEKRWDFLVFGQADRQIYGERVRAARAIAKAGFSVAWADRWVLESPPPGVEALPFRPSLELPELMSQSRCVLCCDMDDAGDGYWSDRVWLSLGAGALVLRRLRPGMDLSLHCLNYVEPDEACYKADVAMMFWNAENRQKLEDLSWCSRNRVMKEETYECRLRKLLAMSTV